MTIAVLPAPTKAFVICSVGERVKVFVPDFTREIVAEPPLFVAAEVSSMSELMVTVFPEL
jgi:hypothetical protein